MNLGKENEDQEFKLGLGQLDKGIKSLSAMLNRKSEGTVYYGVDDDSFYDPFELEPEKTFDNDYDDDWDFDDESLNEDRLPFESLKKKNEGFKPLQVTSSDYNNDSNKNNIMEDIANEQVNIEDVDDEF